MANNLIELLRITVGVQDEFTRALTGVEWKALHDG